MVVHNVAIEDEFIAPAKADNTIMVAPTDAVVMLSFFSCLSGVICTLQSSRPRA